MNSSPSTPYSRPSSRENEDVSGALDSSKAAVFCADPQAAVSSAAGVPEGFDGRLSLRSVEALGFAETVGALERFGVLICWAQAQQARVAARLEELFARDIARAAGREDPSLALSLAAAEAGAALNLPHMSAMRLVSESSRLNREHPQTLARLAEGRIAYQHARIILDETQHLPDVPDQDTGLRTGSGSDSSFLVVTGAGTDEDGGSSDDRQPPGGTESGAEGDTQSALLDRNLLSPDDPGSGHTGVMTDGSPAGMDPPRGSVRQRFEADLLSSAEGRTAAGFGKKARRLRESLFPQTVPARHRDAVEKRRVCFEALPDGMSCLTAFLAAEQGQAIFTALSGAARAGKTAGDPRTIDQLRSDTLASVLLDGGPQAGNSPRPRGTEPARSDAVPEPSPRAKRDANRTEQSRSRQRPPSRTRIKTEVMVLINADTLAGVDQAPAELNGYGPISAEAGRTMILQALSWTPLLQDPASGEILAVGRRRRIPAGLKRWLQARDGTCRFPGCAVNVTRSEIDHTRPWSRGGPTEHSNLEHLCPKHHRFKTLGYWRARQPEPGTLGWTSPSGRSYTTQPLLELNGPPGSGFPLTPDEPRTGSYPPRPISALWGDTLSRPEASADPPPF